MNSDPGELAELLTAWRGRLSPADLGMPAGANRKVAGLRRAEVAVQAHISVDYLERLEQGRAANPSPQVLEALARTLQLSREERRHMLRAAGLADIDPGLVP